jgi:hypothetical protein
MEWISFRDMVSWFTDEFREVLDDCAMVFFTGLVALAAACC